MSFAENDLSSRSASFSKLDDSRGIPWGAHGQPPPFRATGHGLQNRRPAFKASATNANGILTNPVAAQRYPDLQKMYMFVTEVETGWNLAGATSQAAYHRTFYPKNLSQEQLAITVAMPNQFEYDKAVSFVQHHQHTILTSALNEGAFGSLDFKLLPATVPHIKIPLKKNQRRRYLHRGMHYGVIVTDIEAGHERFMHFPILRLTCTVVSDFISPNFTVQDSLYKNLLRNYMQTFGTIYDSSSQAATGGSNTPEQSGGGQTIDFWSQFDNHQGAKA